MNELRKKYDHHGYHISRACFNERQIKNALDAMNFVLDQQLRLLKIDLKNDHPTMEGLIYAKMKLLFSHDVDRYLKTIKTFSNLPEIYELFISDQARELLKSLDIEHYVIPTGPVVHIMSSDLMIPGGYFGIPPHQDYPSMCGSLDAPIL